MMNKNPVTIDGDTFVVLPTTPTKRNRQQTALSYWRLYFHGLPAVEYVCCPPATLAEMLDRHSLATHAEPFDPVIRRPDAPLNDDAAF